MRNEMTQVMAIPYSGIKRKRVGNRGVEREHWLCLPTQK